MVLLAFNVHGQTSELIEKLSPLKVDTATGLVTYTGIVEVDSVSSSQLYTRAKYWIASAFNSAPDVIKLDDKESGKFIVKGLIEVPVKFYGASNIMTTRFTLKLDVKDGKYRYHFTDFMVEGAGFKTPVEQYTQKVYSSFKVNLNSSVLSLITSIEKELRSSEKKTQSDW